MKKIVLLSLFVIFVVFLFISSVLGAQYLIQEGESMVYNGRNIGLSGVSSSSSVVVTVDNVSKAINKNETKAFDEINIKVIDIYYFPQEDQVSSALLDISETIATTTVPISRTCTDYDGGINYYVKGNVTGCVGYTHSGGCAVGFDTCYGNILAERYCNENNESKSINYTCPYGCNNGACVQENETTTTTTTTTPINKTCTDSDNGLSYYTKGTVSVCTFSGQGIGCGLAVDVCNDFVLTEGYCEGYEAKTVKYTCPNGCVDGACVYQLESTTTTPGRCSNHAQCSQACDYLGTDKWQYSKRWQGTCPGNVYGCMTGDCCIGQCLYTTTGECFCQHTDKVTIYGNVCPIGTTCGSDCYCHPIKDGTRTQVDITSPSDGQTVSGTFRVVVKASGTSELGDMTLSMQRELENLAKIIILTECGGGVACPTIPGGTCMHTKTCYYNWDTTSYDGVVLLTATVIDVNSSATDSVKVNVINYKSCSEQCEMRGYRYGSCKSVCDSGEVDIGIDGCPIVACEACLAGQICSPCPSYTCCCAGKKSCPYECCVNDPEYTNKPCPAITCPACESGGECPSCMQPKCIDHICTWHSEENFVLKFKAGWNMFSFPVDIRNYLTATSQMPATEITVEKAITGHVVETVEIPSERQCSSPDHVWHYSDGRYIDVLKESNSIVNGWGYWIKIDYDCIVEMTGNKITIEDFPELEAGWNQIGAPSEAINFFHVMGDCNLLSGPWWFNYASKKFEKAQVLKPGEGYFVKVKDNCRLGTDIPPLPPEELSLGKAFKIK